MLNHVSQDGAGHANLLSGQTRLGNTSLTFLHKDYDNFSSDRNPGGILESESELRISGIVNPPVINPISYNLIYTDEQRLS